MKRVGFWAGFHDPRSSTTPKQAPKEAYLRVVVREGVELEPLPESKELLDIPMHLLDIPMHSMPQQRLSLRLRLPT